jgi:hypothetical protein
LWETIPSHRIRDQSCKSKHGSRNTKRSITKTSKHGKRRTRTSETHSVSSAGPSAWNSLVAELTHRIRRRKARSTTQETASEMASTNSESDQVSPGQNETKPRIKQLHHKVRSGCITCSMYSGSKQWNKKMLIRRREATRQVRRDQ